MVAEQPCVRQLCHKVMCALGPLPCRLFKSTAMQVELRALRASPGGCTQLFGQPPEGEAAEQRAGQSVHHTARSLTSRAEEEVKSLPFHSCAPQAAAPAAADT